MQRITKLSRRLPGSLILLVTVCVAAQQITQQQPTQRPRRVNGSEQKTEAKKMILVHWEDFFRYPKNPDDIQMVRGTNKKLARRRLNEVINSGVHPEVVMPKPGSLLRIKF